MGSPTVEIYDKVPDKQPDKNRQQKRKKDRPPPGEGHLTRKELGLLRRDMDSRFAALQRGILEMPKHKKRREVKLMVARPSRYEEKVTDAEFSTKVRQSSQFYASFEDDDFEHPPLVHLSWKKTRILHNLNETEVEELEDQGFVVLDYEEDDYNYPGNYIYSIEKAGTHLWLTIMMDDRMGWCWQYTTAAKVAAVRRMDKVRWDYLAPVNASSIRSWPDPGVMPPRDRNSSADWDRCLVDMLRESACYVLSTQTLRKVPADLRNSTDFQVDLFHLVQEMLTTLQTHDELAQEVLSSAQPLDPSVIEARKIIKKQ